MHLLTTLMMRKYSCISGARGESTGVDAARGARTSAVGSEWDPPSHLHTLAVPSRLPVSSSCLIKSYLAVN